MAITKNRQSEETISSMAKMAFPDKQIAEINAMKLVAENCSFKVADVRYF